MNKNNNNIKGKTVRRYIDYPKFLDLVSSKSLYFSSPYQFEDKLDCFVPKYEKMMEQVKPICDKQLLETATSFFQILKLNADKLGLEHDRKSYYPFVVSALLLLNSDNCVPCMEIIDIASRISELWYENKFNEIPNVLMLFFQKKHGYPTVQDKQKDNVLVSCWHIENSEMDAMWKLYSKNDGILFETTTDKLENGLDLAQYEKYGCYSIIDKVKYIDLIKENNRCNNLDIKQEEIVYQHFFHKRQCFSFEKEVRHIIVNPLSNLANKDFPKDVLFPEKNGVKIPIKIKLQDFIDSIIISPYAPSYYRKTLENTLKQMGECELAEKIKLSDMGIDIEQLLHS